MSSDKKLFEEEATYKKKTCKLVITPGEISVYRHKEKILAIMIENIKKIKKKSPTDGGAAKFRVEDNSGEIHDFSFKQSDSAEVLKKVIKITNNETKRLEEKNNTSNATTTVAVPPPSLEELTTDNSTLDETMLRKQFLTKNEVACKMLKELVGADIVSPEDFWDNFKIAITELEIDPDNQKRGYSSILFSDITPDTNLRANELQFTINDDIEKQIFRKKPQIEALYREYVYRHHNPDYVDGSPEDKSAFWSNYFKKVYNHKIDKDKDVIKNTSVEDTVTFDNLSRNKRIRELDPAVTAGPIYEQAEGAGVFRHEDTSFQKVVNSFNMHSELALIAINAIPDTTKPARGDFKEPPFPDTKPLDDLEEPVQIKMKPFSIRESSIEQIVHHDDPYFTEASRGFASIMQDYASSYSWIPDPPDMDDKDSIYVLREMTMKNSRTLHFDPSDLLKPKFAQTLSNIRNHKREQQILLYHFWHNYNSPKQELKDKAVVLKDKLLQLKDILDQEKRMLGNGDLQEQFGPLYEEMDDSFTKVFELFQTKKATESFDFSGFSF